MVSAIAEPHTNYILDTCFWRNYFEDPNNPQLKSIFDVGLHHTPTIVLSEFKNIYTRASTPGFEVHLEEIRSRSHIIDLDEKTAILGGEIRGNIHKKEGKKNRPSLADCIIEAYVEKIKNAIVVSTDEELKRFPNTVVIEVKKKEKLRGGSNGS